VCPYFSDGVFRFSARTGKHTAVGVESVDAPPVTEILEDDVPATHHSANSCAPLSTVCCDVTSPVLQHAGGG